jgi:SOS-response transcriptional repressor LexA
MTGKTDLVADSLLQIAEALGVAPAELLTEYSNVELSSLGTKRLPVWDYVQAGLWAGVSPNLRGEEMQDYVLTDGEYSDAAFALVIKGDSMEPDFKEGEVVIIDPAVNCQPGDFVVAKDSRGEATFKKYRPRGLNDQGKEFFVLEPLNHDYEPMRSDLQQIQILGTMVEHRKYRRR